MKTECKPGAASSSCLLRERKIHSSRQIVSSQETGSMGVETGFCGFVPRLVLELFNFVVSQCLLPCRQHWP